jgi:hypothetical protein
MTIRSTFALAAALIVPAAATRAQSQADNASILTLQGENASISGSQPTDRLYTNGLQLNWTSPTGEVPGFLANLGDTLWGSGQQRLGFGLSQQIYTPTDTTVVPADPHDRPYAGYLSGNISLLSDTSTTRSVLMLSLGIVGPGSGGEALQNGFHDLVGQTHDRGWGSQIPNTPAIELLHERTWRVSTGSVGGVETDFLPALTVGLGDVRDYVQVGGTFRLGQGLASDFGVPRLRPGLSGGDVYNPTRPFAWYIFVGADGQAVGYDLLLQANPFRSGPHVDERWDVAEFQGGAAIMAFGMRLTFAYVAQTQEYEGQRGGLHQFGSASLSVRF